MHLVYLSPVRWTSFAQRPHWFVEWFHKRTGANVLWIDPYPARFPKWSDLRGVMRSRGRPDGVGRAIPPWLAVVTPLAVPIEPLPGSGWLHRVFWHRIFRRVGAIAREHDPALLVIGKPSVMALALIQAGRWSTVVYDAMDDFPAFFSGMSRWAMAKRQQGIVRAVSELWVSSAPLYHGLEAVRADARLVPNGLAAEALADLYRLPGGEKPIFGYVGTIADWFDWRWIFRLAEESTTSEIRLIGPVHTAVPALLPGNIRMLGPCDHQTALRHMQGFDVGLIPFVKSRLTAAVDPIKYYEYKALGLAVLSTDFGQMSYRRGEWGVYLSDGGRELSSTARMALDYVADRAKVDAFRRDVDWDHVFDESGFLDRLGSRVRGDVNH